MMRGVAAKLPCSGNGWTKALHPEPCRPCVDAARATELRGQFAPVSRIASPRPRIQLRGTISREWSVPAYSGSYLKCRRDPTVVEPSAACWSARAQQHLALEK